MLLAKAEEQVKQERHECEERQEPRKWRVEYDSDHTAAREGNDRAEEEHGKFLGRKPDAPRGCHSESWTPVRGTGFPTRVIHKRLCRSLCRQVSKPPK